MKKLLGLLSLVCVLALAACSNVSQKYADKINAAAEAGEHYTVAQIREDLGDEAVEVLILNSGVIYAVKGCETKAEIEELIDAGKEVEGITIVVVAGKAQSAKYSVINEVK